MSALQLPPLERFRDDGPLASQLRRRLRLPGTLLLGLAVAVASAAVLATDALTRVPILAGGLLLALLGAAGHPATRLGWLEPALLRALEYGIVIVLLADRPAAYAVLAALAYRHYDLVYTHRHAPGLPPPIAAHLAGGWELRIAVLIAAAAAGVVTSVALGLAALVVLTSMAASVVAWRAVER